MTAAVTIDIAASHRKRIGCSSIAQALGLSRWGTQYQLWERYTGRAEWPHLGNELRVALGEPMEDVLRPFVAAINCISGRRAIASSIGSSLIERLLY